MQMGDADADHALPPSTARLLILLIEVSAHFDWGLRSDGAMADEVRRHLMRAVPEYHLSDGEVVERSGSDLTDLSRSECLA